MTKLDGDARGGALLSVKHVTGVPIRFIGTGEHLEDLEFFRPEGMSNRILGMGDVLALVDQVQGIVDQKRTGTDAGTAGKRTVYAGRFPQSYAKNGQTWFDAKK